MRKQRQIKEVAVLLNPHIPFGTPFRYERKEQKLDIYTLALCYVQGIRTNQGIDSIPCVDQTARRTKRKKTSIPH
jgi:hypothetical protein